jgi:hypothetical protein
VANRKSVSSHNFRLDDDLLVAITRSNRDSRALVLAASPTRTLFTGFQDHSCAVPKHNGLAGATLHGHFVGCLRGEKVAGSGEGG